MALTYCVALRLLGTEVAAYAAIYAALFPLLVGEGTRLEPGAVINLLTSASALCFIVSERAVRGRAAWLAASGAAFGAVPLAGELGLAFAGFFIAAAFLWRRYPLRTYWPAAAGAAVVVGLSILHSYTATGNPFFKNDTNAAIFLEEPTVFQPRYYAMAMLFPFVAHGGVIYAAAVGFAIAVIERRREALFAAAWLAIIYIFMEFGSSSVHAYRPLFKMIRYLSILSVPAVILAGYGTARIRAFINRPRSSRRAALSTGAVAAGFAVVAMMSLWTLRSHALVTPHYRRALREMREHVRRFEGKTIYVTHWLWNSDAGYALGFASDYFPSGYDPYHAVRLSSVDPASKNLYVQILAPREPMNAGLLLHDERLFEASEGMRTSPFLNPGEIPAVLARIPAQWRLIDRIAIGDGHSVALYEIPDGAVWPASE